MTHLKQKKGYTIIVVMMIMILLSGLAILALNTVNTGVREANLQMLKQQAFESSNSAVTLFSQYAGNNASHLMNAFNSNYQEFGRNSSEGKSNWALRLPENQLMKMILGNTNASTNDKLFSNDASQQTWEKMHPSSYNVVVRDLSDGIPAPGYSGNFCFKRALVSGESTVGLTKSTGENNSTFANAVTAQETLIGPIRCN